jgi:hypothetical protein
MQTVAFIKKLFSWFRVTLVAVILSWDFVYWRRARPKPGRSDGSGSTTSKPVVLILGGGIRGASIAAAISPWATPVVIDPRPGSGATGKSDSRAHSGLTGVEYDDWNVSDRKLRGGTLLALLWQQFVQTQKPALYGFVDRERAERLMLKGAFRGISIGKAHPPADLRGWFAPEVQAFYEVAEKSFDGPGLTGALLRLACSRGGRVVEVAARAAWRTRSGQWEVTLANGERIIGDVLLSALASAVRYVTIEGVAARGVGDYLKTCTWAIAAVEARAVPPVDRVLVSAGSPMASIVPHAGTLAIDTKPLRVREIEGMHALPSPNPAPYNRHDEVQEFMIENLRRQFKPLASLRDEAFSVIYCSHARSKPNPASPHRTESDIIRITEPLPRYLLTLGGMATTSGLDAVDVVAALRKMLGLPALENTEVLHALSTVRAAGESESWRLRHLYAFDSKTAAAANDNAVEPSETEKDSKKTG